MPNRDIDGHCTESLQVAALSQFPKDFEKCLPCRTVFRAAFFVSAFFLLTWFLVEPFSLVLEALGAPPPGGIDLLQYWAASKIFFEGQNPYDPNLLLEVQRGVSSLDSLPVLMWNPPLIFPMIMFLAAMTFRAALLFWFILSCALIGVSFGILLVWNRCVEGSGRILPLLFLLTFYPLSLSLFYGQISPIILFGLSAFLLLEKRSPYSAGLSLSLTLVKPHLLYLVYMFLLIRAWKERGWKVILGLMGGCAVLSLLPFIWQPDVSAWYMEALQSPPVYWKTPTAGSFLQGAAAGSIYIPRILPTLVTTALAFVFFVRAEKLSLCTLLCCIPVSLVTSPYGWVYDQMLLLPCALYVLAVSRSLPVPRRFMIWILLFGANVLMMAIPGSQGQQVYLWYPLCFSAALLLCGCGRDPVND